MMKFHYEDDIGHKVRQPWFQAKPQHKQKAYLAKRMSAFACKVFDLNFSTQDMLALSDNEFYASLHSLDALIYTLTEK